MACLNIFNYLEPIGKHASLSPLPGLQTVLMVLIDSSSFSILCVKDAKAKCSWVVLPFAALSYKVKSSSPHTLRITVGHLAESWHAIFTVFKPLLIHAYLYGRLFGERVTKSEVRCWEKVPAGPAKVLNVHFHMLNLK